MPQVLQVAIPRPVGTTYDYVNADSQLRVPVGVRVMVPFGHVRTVGVVLGQSEHTSYSGTLKTPSKYIELEPILPPDMIELVKWLSSYYHFPLGAVLEVILPTEAMRGRPVIEQNELLWSCVDPKSTRDFKRAHRQQECWDFVRQHGRVSDTKLRQANIEKSVLKALEKKGLLASKKLQREYIYKPAEYELSKQQTTAVRLIEDNFGKFHVHVLDGVTGSGKTEVYIQVIKEVLARGQQVLVLVPEIGLTPQTANVFQSRFGHVDVLHSMRTNVQRFDVWSRIVTGEAKLVIGTRSAIFAPFRNLGLIVIDEEHDSSYKQIESLRYSARDVAIMRAKLLEIPCILGSATLSLETVANSRQGRFQLSKLTHRPGTAQMPDFNVLDIKGEILHGGITPKLLNLIAQHLDSNNQVLVLLNRRGYATSLICHSCGWRKRCDECDILLTFHEVPERILRCHYCEKRYAIPDECPDCSSTNLIHIGTATQKTEEMLKEHFKNVPVHRVDRDVINTQPKLARLFVDLQNPSRSILIGTQMLAKGHHLPNVTLVVVLGADSGFLSSDFRAPERTVQLIVQVAGRAGRAEKPGEVWIQTYDPEHPHLTSLSEKGYSGFMDTELVLRKDAGFPPYRYLALLRSENVNAEEAELLLKAMAESLASRPVTVLGPAPAPVSRIANRWRFQLAVLADHRKQLHDALDTLNVDSKTRRNYKFSIDVDPLDMA